MIVAIVTYVFKKNLRIKPDADTTRQILIHVRHDLRQRHQDINIEQITEDTARIIFKKKNMYTEDAIESLESSYNLSKIGTDGRVYTLMPRIRELIGIKRKRDYEPDYSNKK